MKKRANGTFAGIMRCLRPYWFYLLCTVVLAIVNVAASLAVPYLAGLSVDCIVGRGNVDYIRLYELFIAIGICIGGAAVSQWLMSLCNNKIAYHVLADVRRYAFRRIEVLPLSYIDARAYGEIASVVITDAEQFSEGLLLGFTQIFTGIATIVGVLVIMILMRWEIALIVFCITPL